MSIVYLGPSILNSLATSVSTACNNGFIRIYNQTNEKLAELRFGDPAFGPVNNGTIVANEITPDFSANLSGIAATFIIFQSNGVTEVMRGQCGTNASPRAMNFDTLTITQFQTVKINSFVYRA